MPTGAGGALAARRRWARTLVGADGDELAAVELESGAVGGHADETCNRRGVARGHAAGRCRRQRAARHRRHLALGVRQRALGGRQRARGVVRSSRVIAEKPQRGEQAAGRGCELRRGAAGLGAGGEGQQERRRHARDHGAVGGKGPLGGRGFSQTDCEAVHPKLQLLRGAQDGAVSDDHSRRRGRRGPAVATGDHSRAGRKPAADCAGARPAARAGAHRGGAPETAAGGGRGASANAARRVSIEMLLASRKHLVARRATSTTLRLRLDV